jgi:hypothetical protein
MSSRRGIPEMAGAAADDLLQLVSAHLQLARAELAADLRKAGPRLARLAAFTVLAVLGYASMVVAGALVLAASIGLPRSLLLLGGIHALVGTVGFVLTAHRSDRRRFLERTTRGISGAVAQLAAADAGRPRLPGLRG